MFSSLNGSDLLRTAGAAFLLTRSSTILKGLGFLWLAGTIYSVSQREKRTGSSPSSSTFPGMPKGLSLNPFKADPKPAKRDRDALIPTSLDGYAR
jgi:hypothetical protein